VPKWFVIEEEAEKKLEAGSSGAGARLSRSLTVGSKYAKVKRAAPCNGHVDGESSEECTDDEIYLTRHKPFEEQEVRFRHPKQQEREKNHKEALKKEGSVYKNGSSNAEDAYKSLWYRGDKSEDRKDAKLSASPVLNAKLSASPVLKGTSPVLKSSIAVVPISTPPVPPVATTPPPPPTSVHTSSLEQTHTPALALK